MKTILIILLILIILYLWLIKPNLNKERIASMKSFEEVYIAHRGLFNNKDIPENSISAFKKAYKEGYGVELDVQLTTDGKLVVFHDGSLKRMCKVDKKIYECSYDELQQLNLLDTNEKIPLFKDVLDCFDEKMPLVVEIKSDGDYITTVKKTVEMLKTYDRNYTMESFHPMVIKWLKDNHPEIIRGQLAYGMTKDKDAKLNPIMKFAMTYLLSNVLTRPDYVAYDIKNSDNLSFRIISKLYKGECVAWTIKNQEQLIKAKEYYKQFIFDSFIPEK